MSGLVNYSCPHCGDAKAEKLGCMLLRKQCTACKGFYEAAETEVSLPIKKIIINYYPKRSKK